MTKTSPQHLFARIQVGALALNHRVVMAPLTRLRADLPGDVPNQLMVEYYRQRASEGGLIISEATNVTGTNRGYLGAPGIYSDEQIAGWRKVTDAVHQKGGRIFLQLWHVGRTSHVDLNNGAQPVAPSAVPFEGVVFTAKGWGPTSPSRPLETDEIPEIIALYRAAAERAKRAGFDGVEVHGANGYLLDQFLQDGSNKRTDAYGGPIENRARLLLEVTEAVVSVWGGDRVGVRLSPSGSFNGMSDSDPNALFDHVAGALNRFGLAYLHIVEPRVSGNDTIADSLAPVASARLRRIFKSRILAAGGFEPDSAEAIIRQGDADLVAFGRHFISNPDLPKRIARGLTLNPYDRDTFYSRDGRGYVDYPFYGQPANDSIRPAIASIA